MGDTIQSSPDGVTIPYVRKLYSFHSIFKKINRAGRYTSHLFSRMFWKKKKQTNSKLHRVSKKGQKRKKETTTTTKHLIASAGKLETSGTACLQTILSLFPTLSQILSAASAWGSKC